MSAAATSAASYGQPRWSADTIDPVTSWYVPLPHAALESFGQAIAAFGAFSGNPGDISSLCPTVEQRAACRELIARVESALERGRGFVIIDRIPLDICGHGGAQVIYWLIGHMLGVPFAQNVQGTLLYDVRDTGKSVAEGARFSVTNYESSFHTDNSFGLDVLDYVGLLCLQTAKQGGLSQVVSGYAIVDELRNGDPAILDTLAQPFHVDRRGGTLAGEAPTVQFPVIAVEDERVLCRYLRAWIESGHQKAGQPLTAAQTRSLDFLDSTLARPEWRAEFALEPGQIFFINNRWILHNRTAFEDHASLDRRRHLVRLWLRARR
jgi:hypothetical protein